MREFQLKSVRGDRRAYRWNKLIYGREEQDTFSQTSSHLGQFSRDLQKLEEQEQFDKLCPLAINSFLLQDISIGNTGTSGFLSLFKSPFVITLFPSNIKCLSRQASILLSVPQLHTHRFCVLFRVISHCLSIKSIFKYKGFFNGMS